MGGIALSYLGKPVIPKEHGAWMVLLVSLTAGSMAVRPAGAVEWAGFALLTVSTLFGFLAFTPFRLMFMTRPGANRGRLAAWFIIYSIIAAGCFLALVARLDLHGLLWFIIPALLLTVSYFWWNVAGAQRNLPVEITGIIGLAAAGPAASYVQQNEITKQAVVLYVLLIIWFTDRMMTVRKTLGSMRRGVKFETAGSKARWFARELSIHAAALASVAAVITLSGGLVPWTAFSPFLLATAKSLVDIASVKNVDDPMKVGFAEMRLGIAFSLLMIAAWRFGGAS